MGELISGKEAMLAWYDDKEVFVRYKDDEWRKLTFPEYGTGVFKSENHTFKLKPETIIIQGYEIQKPKDICIDPTIGSVGLVYGDVAVAKKMKDYFEYIFQGI
ncbi:MAG: hypothetical protein KBT03_00410 [Bacteroidales bacterium]|nr:hypothetical protein [Candidatus Scybalousia scybalohippi]